jgi:DNA-binding IclR family transcriptional regulator
VPFRHHRTVDRVVAICEAVARDGRGLTLGDLADRLQAPKSSIQELTNGLLATGYLVEEQKKFFLGPAPFVLTLMSNPVAARAIEHDDLIRLSKKMGTTVLIAIQVGDTYVHLDQVGESAGPAVLHGVRIRQRRPLLETASGKIILANLAPQELDHALLTAARSGPDAIDRFMAELPEIRRSGVAFNYGATVTDAYAAATGIYDRQGRFVAAVSIIVGPERADELQALGKRLLDEARALKQSR